LIDFKNDIKKNNPFYRLKLIDFRQIKNIKKSPNHSMAKNKMNIDFIFKNRPTIQRHKKTD
jgi:hypothetical protein